MKRLLTLLIAALMLLALLASCGEQPENPPASSDLPGSGFAEPASGSEQESEPDTEPATEPATEPEEPLPNPDKPVYEYEYAAPEDGSFSICGIPLSEYSMVLFFPSSADYNFMNRKLIVNLLKDTMSQATGTEWDLKVVKNEKYDTEKWAEHEILFGSNFHREGMPESDMKKNYYGVTADGTVYFSSPSPMMYRHLWQLFLEEFFGVPYESGEQSGGCAITECYRELPNLDEAWLKQQGYETVWIDEFEGDSLNLDVWDIGQHVTRSGFESAKQVRVADGKLTLVGEYDPEGALGEGWYGADIRTRTWYCYGYYKAIIKCSENVGRNEDFWSAFWIQSSAPYDPAQCQGGIGPGGAELDIMECWGPDAFSSTIWITGYEGNDGLDSDLCEVRYMGNDYSADFHTFALLWDEDYYRFYVDGLMVAYTKFGYGTSHVEETVALSLCVPANFSIEPGTVREMVIESVEVWQKPVAGE